MNKIVEPPICRSIDELNQVMRSDTLLLLQDAKEAKLPVAIFETFRTEERQKFLHQKGTSNLNVGWHCFRLAVDIWPVLPNGKWPNQKQFKEFPWWKKLSELGGKRGFRCGSAWGDMPHFEQHYGLKLATLQTIFEEKGINGVDAFIKLWLGSKI